MNNREEWLKESKFIVNELLHLHTRMKKVRSIIQGVSYYPEKVRKSKAKMWLENLQWMIRNHEVNRFYTSWGLDVEEFRSAGDFIPNHEFVRIRNKGNQRKKITGSGSYNYIVMLRDKYIFSEYLAQTLGERYVPKSVGVLTGDEAFDVRERSWISIEDFFRRKEVLVLKTVDGECADGVVLAQIEDGFINTDTGKIKYNEFLEQFQGQKLLAQEVIRQHEKLAKINPYCVNTIRIVTVRGKTGKIGILAAFLRLGVLKDSFVDNRAKGGMGVGIHLNDGKLMKYGLVHADFGTKELRHPISKIEFEGYQLPYWEEVKVLVEQAHKQFYEIQSIGWDVVLTPEGPVLLEGNDDWEIGGPQDTYGGLKHKWNMLLNQ